MCVCVCWNGMEQWTITQPSKEENHAVCSIWMELQIITLSEVSQRKTNPAWYHLQVESKIQCKSTATKQNESHRDQNYGCRGEGE